MKDFYGRTIDYMRISVTDRCNFRCIYCMPPEGTRLMAHSQILTYEEILRIAALAAKLGIRKLRVTGGELFVRKGILDFLEKLVKLPGIETVAVTTNGSRLKEQLSRLRQIGIRGINISLDTMNRDRFFQITGRDELPEVLEAIRQAVDMDFCRIKLNCVPMRGINEADLVELAGLAREMDIDVRFIELMPLGLGSQMQMISQDELLRSLEASYGSLVFENRDRTEQYGNGPAVYGRFPGFAGRIGFISPMSHEFCSSCSRLRLLADGGLKACLNQESGKSLRDLIRSGASDEELTEAMRGVIRNKPLRHGFETGAECRYMSSIGG